MKVTHLIHAQETCTSARPTCFRVQVSFPVFRFHGSRGEQLEGIGSMSEGLKAVTSYFCEHFLFTCSDTVAIGYIVTSTQKRPI